jgi:hypothetical protein
MSRSGSLPRSTRLHPHQIQPDALRNASIKEVSPNCFAHVGPKYLPGVGLREDVERQTLSAITTIRLLRDFED